jgi:hypothetical protein
MVTGRPTIDAMVRRYIARLVFGTAAVAAVLLSMGAAVPPHEERFGTPTVHEHALSAYRYAFLVDPITPHHLIPAMSPTLHEILMAAGIPMADMAKGTSLGGPAFKSIGVGPALDFALVLALLVAFVPRLARPTRRVVATFAIHRLAHSQWLTMPALAPPRLFVLPSLAA